MWDHGKKSGLTGCVEGAEITWEEFPKGSVCELSPGFLREGGGVRDTEPGEQGT